MPTPSFAAVLDEALSRAAHEPLGPGARGWASRPAPQVFAPFLFSRPLTSPAPRWTADAQSPARPSAPRPAHRLDHEQRQALARLIDLGAELPAGFTAEELLREFRRLALRYHPDRHTGSTAVERELLERNFGHATESYRVLRAVVDARH